MERTLTGISASPGIAIGSVRLLLWEVPDVPHAIIPDDAVDAEIARFHAARAEARQRLDQVRRRVEERAGATEAAIFEVQQMLLDDPTMLEEVESLIRHNVGAAQAFHQHMADWRQRYSRATDSYLRERVGDILDLEIRMLSVLLGLQDHDPLDIPSGQRVILVSHDLTPSLTVQLERSSITAIATDVGTRTSHVAILARSLGIPAVVGLRDATERLRGGELVILDGSAGTLNVNPTDEELALYRDRERLEAERAVDLAQLATADAVSTDGVEVVLLANVDVPEEAERAARSGARGVGLMRTEFLVLGRAQMPDEEEQYRAYRRVVEAFAGQPVMIRTFDIGGDKLPVGGFPQEANPFLGWRAIRMCLDQPELFKVQLRALIRAAVHGNVKILLPLIVSPSEVSDTVALLSESAAELEAIGVPHRDDVPLGVMVETPAAAVIADRLAPLVSFFSVGTNDLVQYTLAVDRGNVNLASRFTPMHPSVLRLIRRVVEVGISHGVEVAVCGEMASHPLTAYTLVGLGIRELSVAPRSVPVIKSLILGICVSRAEAAVRQALEVDTAAEAEEILRASLIAEVGDAGLLE
ncbi:MAG TPA: phosphoenolpyruvate--protein phosphotransferase [Gemmatimonadaceae bacterium]|nr:phosphoenolpyruvate--protein phosphotransferase [Gemmatimonadaceae bacterium]